MIMADKDKVAVKDNVVNFQLELPQNILLSISDMSQALTLWRYIVNHLGEKLTVQKTIIAVGLKDIPDMLKFYLKSHELKIYIYTNFSFEILK